MLTDFIGRFTLLAAECIRFVVGGLALLLHGLDRLTVDVDHAWRQAALQLAYQSGAIKPRRPDSPELLSANSTSP